MSDLQSIEPLGPHVTKALWLSVRPQYFSTGQLGRYNSPGTRNFWSSVLLMCTLALASESAITNPPCSREKSCGGGDGSAGLR